MEIVSHWVIYMVVACAVLGALAAVRNEETGLGREFMEGLRAIGPIFIPVAGIMASIPFLSRLVEATAGPVFQLVGADPSIAATSVIAVDMGGYKLAGTLAGSVEDWIMAVVVGYMAGATIVFSIPVGLALLPQRDHRYLALGMMSGILSVPVGVVAAWILLALTDPEVQGIAGQFPANTYRLDVSWSAILRNAVPLLCFVGLLALGLRFLPALMIRLFIAFGRLLDAAIKIVLVATIAEMTTTGFLTDPDGGILSAALGSWGFDPIVADREDQMRALEVAGYIGMMLCGAFPMVYLLRKRLAGPVDALGRKIGLQGVGAAGLLASVANILAMYRLVPDMLPKDKVVNISFAVCGAFLLGDHLAFTANFQPSLVLPIMVGKVIGGIAGLMFALWLSVPRIRETAEHEEPRVVPTADRESDRSGAVDRDE